VLEQYAIVPFVAQAEPVQMPKEFEPRMLAEQYGSHLLRFLYPLAQELHTTMDSRPLRTLVQTVEALVAFRDSTHGLLLTALGSHLDGLGGGGGGTKRLGTLIRHRKWKARQIDTCVWQRADAQIRQWDQLGEDGLVIWDGTVLEKPESLSPEGLCAVRSSKAVRLTHVKKGYSHPAFRSHFRARDTWDRSVVSRSASKPGTPEFDQYAVGDLSWGAGQSRKG
jgi:hypothetical protein